MNPQPTVLPRPTQRLHFLYLDGALGSDGYEVMASEEVGPQVGDEFVFRFSMGARAYEAMTYSLSGGELRQEMQATTIRVDWPEIELMFPTGAAYLGRVSADGNLIDGQLLYGKDSGPTLPLRRVDDAGRYPQLPRIGGRPRE